MKSGTSIPGERLVANKSTRCSEFPVRPLLIFIFLLAGSFLLAQPFQYVYFTPRDGLINSRVHSIQQDSKGRMIFVTFSGLSFYDGVRFTNYRQQDGLAHELVNDIIEISPDSFLIATNTHALNTLVRGKISLLKTADQFYPVVNKFLLSADSQLYVIADDGLYRWNHNRFSKLPLLDAQGKDIGVNLNQIVEWHHYFLILPWNLNQKEKLIIYDRQQNKVVGALYKKGIASIALSAAGELWLTSRDGVETVDLTALQQGKIVLHPLPGTVKAPDWKSANLYFDTDGDTWIYQNNEVYHIDKSGDISTYSAAQGLHTSNLTDLFVDREGITWLASDGNGIVKMQRTNVQFVSNVRLGIKNNISSLTQQSDTTWMFNRTGNSFCRMHRNQVTCFPLAMQTIQLRDILIHGQALYFNSNQVMFRIEDKDLSSSYAHPVKVFADSMQVIDCGPGIVDPYGNIIQTIRTEDAAFYLVVIYQKIVIMKQPLRFLADQLAFDQDGILWVPTRDNHLVGYSLHPEEPDRYLQLAYDHSAHIAGTGPRSIAIDTAGHIWMGTRYQGIYHLKLKDQHFQSMAHITTQHGLTDNFHHQLYADPRGHIWAGAQTGLDKISYSNGDYIIENITQSQNIFQGILKIIRVADDVIWAMTSNGSIIMITENTSHLNRSLPSLFITSLLVNDSTFDASTTVFNHHQNNFLFRVAATSFIDEKSITYSYRLQGRQNNNWSEGSNAAEFNFINLPSGHYTLHVKAVFPAAMYPDQELTYAFMIKPPFWLTWWFNALLLVFILGISGLLIRYYYAIKFGRQRRLLERKQAIEKERTRIATDMHDDLGAGLSRIKFLGETIGIKKQQQLPIDDEIIRIGRYSHEMIDKMGEIVWALNEKNDSLSDLISYTRSYAVEYLTEHGIKSNMDKLPLYNARIVNGEFRRNVYLSVKEVLHNIIKHARAETVAIRFEANSRLSIEIRDDGIGFDPLQTGSNGNGLGNIRKRMSEIGGAMQVIRDKGTCIILSAPLPE